MTISYDGEVGLYNSFQEVKALLLGSCHQCLDGSSPQVGKEQVGSRRMTDPIGYRIK